MYIITVEEIYKKVPKVFNCHRSITDQVQMQSFVSVIYTILYGSIISYHLNRKQLHQYQLYQPLYCLQIKANMKIFHSHE